ncbi:MAG: SgcJ/EcaC family oxidoreductase [Pseudomonadota bacterium]|uniref:YybH family protein n=1 Tax=Sphingomonas sp. ERG5 TaxID=1381597 RepID=UPI001F472D87|nr:SgcJ/EcaC family oxidoreductase [Sphingomonas sp. ERG5]
MRMGSMITGGIVAITAVSVAMAAPSKPEQARAAVQAVLDASAKAWNAGDLDRFMTCYDKAPTTTYVSGDNFVQGYDAIRARYAQRFGGGTRAAMGELTLEIVDFRMLGNGHAYVVGRFHLHRDAANGGDASGPTTLVFAHTASGWRIVADHS